MRNLISNVKWNPDYSGRSGEGADPCPPLLLDQTEATRAENIFWENALPPPPYLRVWMTGPSLIWRPGSATGLNIYFCFILLLTSSSPCHKDQFAVSYFSTSCYCTDTGLQLGDPAPLIGLSPVDLLIFYILLKHNPMLALIGLRTTALPLGHG